MSKKAQKSGKSYKNAYKDYLNQNREKKNRIRKLQRVVKEQPNNEVAKAALIRAEKGATPHSSGRKSSGHVCKNLCKELGFTNNTKSEYMKKGIHWYICPVNNMPSAEKPPKDTYISRLMEEAGIERGMFRKTTKVSYARKRKKTS